MRLWLKLLLTYSVMICATAMLSISGVRTAVEIRDSFEKENTDAIPHLLALKDLRYAALRIVASSMEYAFITGMDSAGKSTTKDHDFAKEKREELRLLGEGRETFQRALVTCRSLLDLDEIEQYRAIELAAGKLLASSDHYLRLVDSHASRQKLLVAKESFENAEKTFFDGVTVAHDHELHHLDAYLKNSYFRVSRAITSAQLFSIFAITVSLVVSLAVSLSILRRIRLLNEAARAVASGNRNVVLPVTSHDEITSVSVSFNNMVETLREFEKRLDSTNRYLDSIITTMPEALAVVSVDGSILDINPATEEILEVDRNGIVGRDFADLFSPREEGVDFITAVVTGGGVVEREAVLLSNEGRRINVNLAARMLDTEDLGDRFICLSHDITRRKVAEQEVRSLAYFDQLTGLANRSLFLDRASKALAHARRHHGLFAILFFDLDHFKDINDTIGHHAGDRLLQLVVQRLQCVVRATDTFARFGGDEFALLCTSITDADGAAKVAQKFLRLLKEPFAIDNRQVHSGASIGIVIYPQDGSDIGELLRNADLAMYAAKRAGGNRYQFFSDELNEKAQERAVIEGALRDAMRREELTVHYQPQLDIRSGRVIGMEALARWEHPQLGTVPPDRFIPVAEQSGLIEELGAWVLSKACAQCKKWHRQGHGITIGVNVSMLQLMHGNFSETVISTLLDAGLDPQHLDLELTESMLMENADQSVSMLRHLKSLGIRVSIDDFGTGYSSLSYLKNFAIDRIKVDKSFVRDLTSREDVAGIVKAIVAIGHSMGLTVIAEGVESLQEEEKLISCGCDEVQGYYYGRPMSAAEAETYLSVKSQLAA